MAAPHVSGAVLLLKEAFPNVSGAELLTALYNTAIDMGTVGEDNTYGNGLIDVHAAYQELSLTHTPVDPTQVKWDLAILELSKPSANGISCDGSYSPIVKIMNKGDSTITKINFGYKVNTAGLPVGFTWNGNLASGQSTTINLPSVTFTGFGSQELVLESVIDGSPTEYDLYNNRHIVRFDRREKLNLPFVEDFENGLNENWIVNNEDGAIGWDTVSISGRGSNSQAVKLGLYSYNPRANQHDGLISPEMALPLGSNPKLKFDLSYQRLLTVSAVQDTFRVLASTDCGASFPHLLYELYGTALSTNDTATQNFMPLYESHWRRDSVDLQALAGNDVLLQFVGVNRKGNNLYLDNISVFTGPDDPIGLQETTASGKFSLFPNPVKNVLNIAVEEEDNKEKELKIYNSSGRLVKEITTKKAGD